MEKIEEIGFGGLRLIQSEGSFRFGIDAVLLAGYACRFCPGADRVVDLGTGNGIVPLIIHHKLGGCHVTGVDIQAGALENAARSSALNGLEDQLQFVQCDVSELPVRLPELRGAADLVVSNPPYVARGAGIVSEADSRYLSRQETTAGVEEFTAAAAFALKDRGHFVMVHRPSRLVDVFCFCRKYALEPKHIQLVAPRRGSKPNIVLVHCVKGGGRELAFSEELYVYDEAGNYTPEILKIYEKQVEKISK